MNENGAPNDPSFGLQWGHSNTGQLVNGVAGTAGADERSVAAWGVTTGSRSIVVAEVDSGVDYNHPDLAANVWTNPGGVGGCPAGTHGYNVLAGVCDPMDDETNYGGHGTHVAGIMGAVGNNGIGVAGVNWATTILPVKWLDSMGNGSTSGLISALNWVLQAQAAGVNVRVVNDSATFVGTSYSQALSDEIDLLGQHDILFVTAAGNTGDNNDTLSLRRYPCGYDRPTEICVTASNQNDTLPSWANYGPTTVDLAAPGDNIYSTLRNGTYGYISGGSMASPQVAGAAALILSTGYLSATALKAQILNNVDPIPALNGLVRSGGRLNICKAIPACASAPPPPATFGQTAIGGTSDSIRADRKRVNRYQLPTAGNLTKLTVYLKPTGTSGSQQIKGVIYADASGSPGGLLAVTNAISFQSTQTAGWYDLAFPSSVALQAGNYWLGFISGSTSYVAALRYTSVTGSRTYNANKYTAGASNPFGSGSVDNEQMSEYATYTPSSGTVAAPFNSALPTISGTPQQGQTLTASTGTWQNSPTGYGYQWLDCGTSCTPIGGATSSSYLAASSDIGLTLEVTVTATNSGGSTASTSAPTATVLTAAPVNTTAPAISGTAQVGQTLTASTGSWQNSPTGYGYQWLDCGTSCTPIGGATSSSYLAASSDVGLTLEVTVTATNSGGSTASTSAPTATVQAAPPAAPVNTTAPTISGTAQVGQTLTASTGSWQNSPTSYGYQWFSCANGSCIPISGATGNSYQPVAGDVGRTLDVSVTASNSAGSTTATAAGTAPVQAASATTAIFGTTAVGGISDSMLADRKRVNRYSLPVAGSVTKLTIYLQPTSSSGTQLITGVLYADNGGAPGALLGKTAELSFKSTQAAGWYDLTFASPIALSAGSYWIGMISGATSYVAGFRYTSVSGSRDYNANTYASGPSNPFGTPTIDGEQMSEYASYTSSS